jgi:hypothetical protein
LRIALKIRPPTTVPGPKSDLPIDERKPDSGDSIVTIRIDRDNEMGPAIIDPGLVQRATGNRHGPLGTGHGQQTQDPDEVFHNMKLTS